MICAGCQVQGFYPHDCQITIELEHGNYTCLCPVEPSCARWTVAEELV